MNAFLYLRTIRHLKWKQIVWRLVYKFYQPKIKAIPNLNLKKKLSDWNISANKKCSMISETKFFFLNLTHPVVTALDWNNSNYEKLWLYHLHYFDDLSNPISKKSSEQYQNLIARWIKENPIPHGNGWEPYPCSRRIPNWIKWHLSGIDLTKDAIHSLTQQSLFLEKKIEYHLLGNHLLANAKALIFAGLFFSDPIADRWYKKGLTIYKKELKSQILSDGGHIEQSPMYHAIILEDLLDIIYLHQIFQTDYPSEWHELAQRMLYYSQTMTHPDGQFAFFNDTVINQSATYEDLKNYAAFLNIAIPPNNSLPLVHLKESGYVRAQQGNIVVFADIGNIADSALTGHTHADTLSFEFSLENKRVFVNSGISTYSLGEKRQYQRGNAAHNTLTIDKKNSIEVWHSFRCGYRGHISNAYVEKVECNTIISGTYQLNKNLSHTRKWQINSNGIQISDQIDGPSIHLLSLYLHCHPNFTPKLIESNQVELFYGDKSSSIICAFPEELKIQLIDAEWYPEFGKKIKNVAIVGELKAKLPKNIEWSIS